jgi:hypothetical protein
MNEQRRPNGVASSVGWFWITAAVAIIVLLCPEIAAADKPQAPTQPDPSARTLGIFATVGYLGSPGASGGATNLGVRWGLNRHLALSADYGYGLIGAAGAVQDANHRVQDRWWIMPAVAWLIPTSRVQLDLGAGLGFATASGYPSLSSFGAAPFGPAWAFQLAPAVRAHAVAAVPLTRDVDLLARVDAGSLILGGNSIGIRSGNPNPGLMDTTWLLLSLGVRYRLF